MRWSIRKISQLRAKKREEEKDKIPKGVRRKESSLEGKEKVTRLALEGCHKGRSRKETELSRRSDREKEWVKSERPKKRRERTKGPGRRKAKKRKRRRSMPTTLCGFWSKSGGKRKKHSLKGIPPPHNNRRLIRGRVPRRKKSTEKICNRQS